MKKNSKINISNGKKTEFSLPLQSIVPTVMQQQNKVIPINDALVMASNHQNAGRFKECETILRKILQAQPKNAKALHAMGILANAVGNVKVAAQFVAKAIEAEPGVALFHANMGEMCRLLKRGDEAIIHGKKAIELDSGLAFAYGNLGIAYYDKKDYEKAEECQRAALKLKPDLAVALNNMGSIYRERKDEEKASSYYRQAIKSNPDNLEAQNNLAVVLTKLDQLEEAMAILNKVIAKSPRYAEAHANLGFALLILEKDREALACFDRALRAKPDYAEAYIGVARAYHSMHELDLAEKHILKAQEIDPDMAESYSVSGTIYLAQGLAELAKKSFKKALKIDPELASAKQGLGNVYLEEGKFKEAEKLFVSNINGGDDKVGSLFSLAQTKKVKAGDKVIALVEKEAEKINELPDNKKIYIHFALGKIYDDLGEYDKAFENFIEGCRLKRQKISYNAEQSKHNFTRTKEIFTKEFIKKNKGHGFKSDAPVFVLGMPRSGTTLTEQIIASHPAVHGAGEIFDLLDLANWKGKKPGPLFPENMANLTHEQLNAMGRSYAEGVIARDKKALKITDKMPANFFHIGLIHLILPDAKIVHVSRDPLDTCISCFTRLFSHNQNSTYDLNELGLHYNNYNDLMDHWRKVLPKGAFYDIRYEDLVDDTEGQARKLIEYCGLEWDDECLKFHENKRNVKTASLAQVRQPIYKTSLARWKKYEKFLGPLIEGVSGKSASQ